jgi:hypothetical protein
VRLWGRTDHGDIDTSETLGQTAEQVPDAWMYADPRAFNASTSWHRCALLLAPLSASNRFDEPVQSLKHIAYCTGKGSVMRDVPDARCPGPKHETVYTGPSPPRTGYFVAAPPIRPTSPRNASLRMNTRITSN